MEVMQNNMVVAILGKRHQSPQPYIDLKPPRRRHLIKINVISTESIFRDLCTYIIFIY